MAKSKDTAIKPIRISVQSNGTTVISIDSMRGSQDTLIRPVVPTG
jgi:hypothetical protein